MTYVSNDSAWWPLLDVSRINSYVVVACGTAVVYDWARIFAHEFELFWRSRLSFITVLYIFVRYAGILYSVVNILWSLPFSITDQGCNILYFTLAWMPLVVNAMLGVIMMTRIHAMYQRSRKILILLVVVLLASTIASGVMTVIANIGVSGVEFVLSGYHTCGFAIDTDKLHLSDETLIPIVIWEILALCLAVWIVIKHFRELRQLAPTGSTIGDCFTVLIRSHVLYFVAFVVGSCCRFGAVSTNNHIASVVGAGFYNGAVQMTTTVQMFILGPRLILSIREYNAKLVARSDGGTGMTTIALQALGHMSTGGDV